MFKVTSEAYLKIKNIFYTTYHKIADKIFNSSK